METTVIYDTYIENGANGDKNYGALSNVYTRHSNSFIANAIFYWDIRLTDITELKLKLKVDRVEVYLIRNLSQSTQERYEPTNLTFKIDLYHLASPIDERIVTWNNAPKTELLKKDFIVIEPNQDLEGQELTLDLTQYVDSIQNGILLRVNSFILDDLQSKYYTGPNYPHYTLGGAELRVRSSESESNPVLVYNYGEKPLAPKFTLPEWGSIFDKKVVSNINFQWQSEGQTNYIFEYSQDNFNWTQLQGTTQKSVNVPTTGLTTGNLFARVKIKAGGLWSDFSQIWFLQIGEKPNAPTVNISGATTSRPLVSWNTNPLQTLYQVQILEAGNIIEDSGILRGSTNNYTPKIRLENKAYTFKVKIADKNEIWSDWGNKAATITFAMPPTPGLTLYIDRVRGSVEIEIENPSPTSGQEATLYNEVYKKESEEWVRVATNIQNKYTDYAIKPNTLKQYKVRAIGQSGYKDSIVKIAEVKIKHSDISIVGEWERYVKLKYNDTKKQNKGYAGEILKFSGRAKPVVEFEDTYGNEMALSFEINKAEDLELLQSIIDSRKTLLYRDSKGRKIYGSVITKLDIEDREFGHYVVSFTFTETDHEEAI